jgi:transposase
MGARAHDRSVGVGVPRCSPVCLLVHAYRIRGQSLRDLIELFDREVAMLEGEAGHQLDGHDGYRAIRHIPGLGPLFAAVFTAEIGDVTRFTTPAQLASWAGLTPKHRQPDTTMRRSPITKQGSRLVRWAAVEVAQRQAQGVETRRRLHLPLTTATPPGAAKSLESPWPARSSPSSPTTCETAPSV